MDRQAWLVTTSQNGDHSDFRFDSGVTWVGKKILCWLGQRARGGGGEQGD